LKSIVAITISFLCWIQVVLSQVNQGYIETAKLQDIILLYIDGKYENLDTFLKKEGYHKSYVFPKPKLVSINESFTYTNDKLCSKTDIRVEVNRKNDVSTGNDEYCISYVFYSSFLHKTEEEQTKEFLKKYAYNPVESMGTGSGVPTRYIDTNTPESVKRNKDLYFWKAAFYILDGTALSNSFCGLRYRIKYDMYFHRGYASSDTIGFVSTKERSNLRMRDGPSLSSNIIARIPDRSKVFIIEYSDKIDIVNGQSGNWCKIRYDGKTGWVWGYYIRNGEEK